MKKPTNQKELQIMLDSDKFLQNIFVTRFSGETDEFAIESSQNICVNYICQMCLQLFDLDELKSDNFLNLISEEVKKELILRRSALPRILEIKKQMKEKRDKLQ